MFNFARSRKRKMVIPPNQGGFKLRSNTFITRVIFMLIILLFTIGLIFVLRSNLLAIKKINIIGSVSCLDSLAAKQFISQTVKSIFGLDADKLAKRLKAKYLCLDQVVINRSVPNQVDVKLTERQPVIAFKAIPPQIKIDLPKDLDATPSSTSAVPKIDFSVSDATDSSMYLVDKLSIIYQQKESVTNLPIIYTDFDLKLGSMYPNNDVKKILQIFNKLKDLTITFSSSKQIGDHLFLDGLPKLAFSLDKDLNRELASLQLIWQKAKIDSKSMEIIDLRFDKPIVTYSPNKRNEN